MIRNPGYGFWFFNPRPTPHTRRGNVCASRPSRPRLESNQNQFELDFHALGSGGGVGEKKKAKRRARAFGAFGLTEEVKETNMRT